MVLRGLGWVVCKWQLVPVGSRGDLSSGAVKLSGAEGKDADGSPPEVWLAASLPPPLPAGSEVLWDAHLFRSILHVKGCQSLLSPALRACLFLGV